MPRTTCTTDDPAGKFYALLMLFMAAMLGIALSDNLLLLVVFWELTSVSSFLLVGYWGHRADARAGARMALAVTGGGGLALLAGVRAAGPDRRQLRPQRRCWAAARSCSRIRASRWRCC